MIYDSFVKFMNESDQTCLYSLGQAGFVIKNGKGLTVAIDPYLSDCVEVLEGHKGFKRLLPKLMNPEDVEFDIIIATHFHLDHYDKDAMPALMKNKRTLLFAAYDCKSYVEEQEIDSERVKYVKPGDHFEILGIDISFINCDHGKAAPDAVGVIINADGRIICETGDTCLREDFKEEYLVYGNLDVLIAPINGAYGNMNEVECARLSEILSPKVTIPCHYGMFASHGGNVGKFYNIMSANKKNIYLMAQGEYIYI